jgi:3-hydroxyisobutyrate dehydrogenase
MVGIHNVALAEGFSIAVKSGVPADKFLELVKNGSAGSKQAELKGRKSSRMISATSSPWR